MDCKHERLQYPYPGCNGHRSKAKCITALHRGKPDTLGIICLDCNLTRPAPATPAR